MPVIESVMGIQVIGNNGENIIKSPIVEAYIGSSLQDSTEVASDTPTDISTKVEQLMAAKHTHSNKTVLDKFAESDGQPTYDGKAIGGGGASTAEDISYTLSEDVKTEFPDVELESDTVKSGLDVAMYYALAGMFAKYIQCDMQGGGGTVSLDLQHILDNFVFPAMLKAHEHDNKTVLDLLSAADGKLQYNASDINYAPTQYTYSTAQVSATLADNAEYRMTGLQTLTVQYPEDAKFECWMRLSFAASGDITVTLPAGTGYIGTAPDFHNGETWELSFKDKILAAQKVGEGT